MTSTLLLLLTLTASGSALGEPTPSDAAAATVEQQALPTLEARRLSAAARAQAALDWFGGTADWTRAFPEWTHLPLLDPATLIAARAGLAAGSARRAAERVQAAPPGLDRDLAGDLSAATTAACDAEDTAEQLALRFLAGLEAGLAAQPDLGDSSLGAWVLTREAAAAEARGQLLAAPSDADLLDLVARTDALTQQHGALRQALIATWTQPGSTALGDWLPGALASGIDDPGLWVPVLPLLSGDQAEPVSAVLRRRGEVERDRELGTLRLRLEELTLALSAPAPDVNNTPGSLATALGRAELAVDLAQAAQAEAPDAERSDLEVQVAERERDLVRAQLERARDQQTRETVSDEEASHAADAAAVAADQAQARVEAAGARGTDATLERRLKTQRDQVALVRKTDLVLRNQAREARESLTASLEEVQASGATARAMPPLSPERQPALDGAYRGARRLTQDVRKQVRARQAALASWRATMKGLSADLTIYLAVEPGTALNTEWQAAGEALSRAMSDRRDREVADLDRALALLVRTRAERANLRELASSGVRDEDNRTVLDELTTETLEIPIHLGAALRRTTGGVETARRTVGDLAAVQRFLAGLAGTLVLFGIWLLVRPRVEELLRSALAEAGAGSRRRTTDLQALVHPAAPVITLAGDALVTVILLGAVNGRWPIIQLVLWLFLVRRLVQAVPRAVRLAIAAPHESRAALTVTTSRVRELLVSSTRWFMLWWGTLAIVDAGVGNLLQAERMAEWVHAAGEIAGVGLLAAVLWRWGPTIEERVQAAENPNAFVAWLGQTEGGFTLRAVRAVVGSGWLFLTWVTRLLDSREGTSWIGSVLARRHLREDAGQGRLLPLPEALAAIRAQRVPLQERSAALDRVTQHLRAWRKDPNQGLVAVIGDRGAGKGHFLAAAAARFAGHHPVQRLQPPEHHLAGDAGLAWLCMVTEAPPAQDVDEVVAGLLALPRTIWLVDDLHRLFIRRVGGFVALNDVITALRQTAHHHFWLVTCHAATWQYLSGVRQRVPLEAFRDVVRLEALGAEPLAEWILARTAAADQEVDFRGLSNASTLGGDPALAIQRATNAYWRLLSDSSEGNPEVAFELWLASLYGGRGNKPVGVGLPPSNTTTSLDALADMDLFVLAALIVHDGLPIPTLTDVLNLPPERVRTSCRTLQAHGVLTAVGPDAPWYVAAPWRPAVHRQLRLKHVLRGRV